MTIPKTFAVKNDRTPEFDKFFRWFSKNYYDFAYMDAYYGCFDNIANTPFCRSNIPAQIPVYTPTEFMRIVEGGGGEAKTEALKDFDGTLVGGQTIEHLAANEVLEKFGAYLSNSAKSELLEYARKSQSIEPVFGNHKPNQQVITWHDTHKELEKINILKCYLHNRGGWIMGSSLKLQFLDYPYFAELPTFPPTPQKQVVTISIWRTEQGQIVTERTDNKKAEHPTWTLLKEQEIEY